MEIVLYKTDWAWCYDTPNGRMECPPFVQTLGDIESYFDGIPYSFKREPPKKAYAGSRRPRFADYDKRIEHDASPAIPMPRKKEKRGRKFIYHVAQYSLAGKRLAVYPNVRAAAEKLGIRVDTLRKMFSIGGYKCMGFRWLRSTDPDRFPEKI